MARINFKDWKKTYGTKGERTAEQSQNYEGMIASAKGEPAPLMDQGTSLSPSELAARGPARNEGLAVDTAFRMAGERTPKDITTSPVTDTTEPETITDTVEQTYRQQAESIEKGSYLEAAESYENIMGEPAPFKTREEYLQWRKNQNKEDLNYLDEQQSRSRDIEKIQFEKAKQQTRGAISATTAQMAQSREAPMSGSAPMFSSEFEGQMGDYMQQLQLERQSAEAQREKAMVDLKRAQEIGDLNLAQAIEGKIAGIEQDLRQTAQLGAQMELQQNQFKLQEKQVLHQMSVEDQAEYRANLNSFGQIVNSGAEMSNQQISGFANSLGIPFEVADAYYQGAQAIRDDKGIDQAAKQLQLQELSYDFQMKVDGIVGEKAQQVYGVMNMIKSGKLTREEGENMLMGLGISSQMNPLTKMDMRIKNAQALVSEYEAMNLGKGPKKGTIEYYQLEKAKLDLRIAEAENSDYTADVPQTELEAIFHLPGSGKWDTGDNRYQCAEGANKITDGPNLGSNFFEGKMEYVTKKDNPQIGNHLVTSHGCPGNVCRKGVETDHGHDATVINWNPITQTVKTVEWNHNGDGKQTFETYTINELNQRYGDQWGFTDNKLKPDLKESLDQAQNQYATQTGGEVDAVEGYEWANAMIENTYGGAEGGKAVARKQEKFVKALKNGDINTAKSYVVNSLLDGVTAGERTKFEDAINLNERYDRITKVMSDFEQAGMELGLQDVAVNEIYRRLNKERPAEATRLQGELDQAFNAYRKAITGAGASMGEIENLAKSFPSWGRNLEDTKQLLGVVKEGAKSELDTKINLISSGMFSNYEDYQNKLNSIGNPGEAAKQQQTSSFFNSLVSGFAQNNNTYAIPEDITTSDDTDNYINNEF